jgi:hypothetical protein
MGWSQRLSKLTLSRIFQSLATILVVVGPGGKQAQFRHESGACSKGITLSSPEWLLVAQGFDRIKP